MTMKEEYKTWERFKKIVKDARKTQEEFVRKWELWNGGYVTLRASLSKKKAYDLNPFCVNLTTGKYDSGEVNILTGRYDDIDINLKGVFCED